MEQGRPCYPNHKYPLAAPEHGKTHQRATMAARVGVEEKAEEGVAYPGGHGTVQHRDDDDDERFSEWTSRTVQQLSKLYGYALFGAGINVAFATALASLPFTKWQVNGATGSSVGITNATAVSSGTATSVAIQRPEVVSV